MASSEKDKIYASKQDKVHDFIFDDTVAQVFPDMIQRSVPGYQELNQLLPVVANQFIKSNLNVYDLGCSLGEACISIAKSIEAKDIKIFAIDNPKAMVVRLNDKIKQLELEDIVSVKQEDITEVKINNACFVVLNYTLQFIDRNKRENLLNSISSGMNKGGALLLSEKITFEDAEEDNLMQKLHENYKRKNEYSEMEISQKREALENVLIRDTHEQHIQRMKNAGFSKISILSRYLNFVSYLAIK